MYQAPTAPLSIGGVLDNGFQLLKATFGKVIGLAFLSSVLGSAPNFIQPDMATAENATLTTGLLGGSLIAALFSVLFYGAITARIGAVIKGGDIDFMESIKVGLRRMIPLILCFLLYSIAFGIGIFLFIIPGIILGLSLVMGPYLVITEDLGPIDALKRSHNLVWGNWWRTAIIFTVIMFIMAAVYVLAATLAGVGAVASGDVEATSMTANLVIALLTAIITPVTYALGMAVLTDLQLRKDGDDLEDRIEAIS